MIVATEQRPVRHRGQRSLEANLTHAWCSTEPDAAHCIARVGFAMFGLYLYSVVSRTLILTEQGQSLQPRSTRFDRLQCSGILDVRLAYER
jgi:hypothetical protein